MTENAGFAVTALWIYPTKGEPGVALAEVEVESAGLQGDRHKKAALHLVCAVDAAELQPRANLILDATADQLIGLLEQRMTVGTAEIEVTTRPSNCPGVYASVVRPGSVRVGDCLVPSGR